MLEGIQANVFSFEYVLVTFFFNLSEKTLYLHYDCLESVSQA